MTTDFTIITDFHKKLTSIGKQTEDVESVFMAYLSPYSSNVRVITSLDEFLNRPYFVVDSILKTGYVLFTDNTWLEYTRDAYDSYWAYYSADVIRNRIKTMGEFYEY